jgi:hypothetical protein
MTGFIGILEAHFALLPVHTQHTNMTNQTEGMKRFLRYLLLQLGALKMRTQT